MTPNKENHKAKIAHGLRGGIPNDRMEQIQMGLPRSLELRNLNPCLEDPLATLGSKGTKLIKIQAYVRLSQGWHLLNEARSALIEAEACKVFYEEREPNPVEALYRCRFYLDDAALRLCSSCEHLLQCVNFYWGLGVPIKSRDLFRKVITETERSNLPEVSGEVTTSLRGVTTTEWEECKKYRNNWVHNERPGIDGLDWEVSFKSRNVQDIPAAILEELRIPVVPRKSIRVGTGRKIAELHRVVRNAYCQLFGVYERLAPLVG
jgi:Cthe_2314-like HEPN